MTGSFFNPRRAHRPRGKAPPLDEKQAAAGGDQRPGVGGFATEEERLAAVMSYIPFLCFVPLLNMKTTKEARLHARQGVILFLIELVAALFLIDRISNFV